MNRRVISLITAVSMLVSAIIPFKPQPVMATVAAAVETGIPQTNLALNKPIFASSEINDGHKAQLANNGKPEDYYESQYTLPQWLTVDLGHTYSLSRIVMKLPSSWSARTITLAVQGSIDNENFTDMLPAAPYLFQPTVSNRVEVSFEAASARYVRLYFTGNTARTAGVMGELEIYSDPLAPDLVTTNISWAPENPREGDAVTFTATVKNVGGRSTPEGVSHRLAFMMDGEAVALSDNYSRAIPSGETAVITAHGTWTALPFAFDVAAAANFEGTVGERDSANNDDYVKRITVDGARWNTTMVIKDELGIYDFPEDLVTYSFTCPPGTVVKENLKLSQYGTDIPLDYQLSEITEAGGYLLSGKVSFRTALSQGEVKRFALQMVPGYTQNFSDSLSLTDNQDHTAVLSGNLQQVKVPLGTADYANVPLSQVPAPLLSVGRPGGEWIGQGSFQAPSGITVSQITGRVLEKGPLFLSYEVLYALNGGRQYRCVLTLRHNEKYVTVDESFTGFLSKDNAFLRFSYKNGLDPDGRMAIQNGGYSRYSSANTGGCSGGYGDGLKTGGLLPYELGLYSVNSIGLVRSTSFWKDSGDNALLFSVYRTSEWKTEKRMTYNAFMPQNLRFYASDGDKYMAAGLEGTERHWALSAIGRDEMVMEGRRTRDQAKGGPLTIDSVWTSIPADTGLQPGTAPDVKLWQKLSDFSLNHYKDMVFDFPEDTSVTLDLPTVKNMAIGMPDDFWGSYNYATFNKYYWITDKYWDVSSELGGAAWGGRGQRQIYSDYAYNRYRWEDGDRRRVRSLLVFYAYLSEEDNNMPHTAMLGGHANFNLDVKQVLPMAAAIFPRHPHSERWKQAYLEDWQEVLSVFVRQSNEGNNTEAGRWYENLATYSNASFEPAMTARASLYQYDGTDIFDNDTFRDWVSWAMNSLALTDREHRSAPPVGAHSNATEPGGEFDAIYEHLADQVSVSSPLLGENLLWMATNGREGTKPQLESTLYTDYGPVLRYDFGGPAEAFVYLQQLSGSGYRWSANTNGTAYYTAKGKRWSWNAAEDNGDRINLNRISALTLNGKGLGDHKTDGILYNFGFAQYYRAEGNSASAPYLSRGILMVRDDYITLYDDMANTAANGNFAWSNRESGLKVEYFDNTGFTNLIHTDLDNRRFPGMINTYANRADAFFDSFITRNNVSVRWTGQISPAYSQDYTFYVEALAPGDRASIWVDNQLAVDTGEGITNPVTLTAGKLTDFRIDFVHGTGTPGLTWKWSSASQAKATPEGLAFLTHDLEQPSLYPIKEGPGDEFHVVSPAAKEVTAKDYGAKIDSAYTFQTGSNEPLLDISDEAVVFKGRTGYAAPNELALFEGTRVGYDGFILETSGNFGISAQLTEDGIIGSFAGRSGGTVTLTTPDGFSLEGVKVLVEGAEVPHTVNNGSLTFQVDISQKDGCKAYTIILEEAEPAAVPVPNGGFEAGSAEAADQWFRTTWSGNPSFQRDNGTAYLGAYSAAITGSTGGNGGFSKSGSHMLQVSGGKEYTARVWAKLLEVSTTTGDGVYLSVQYYNGQGEALGTAVTSLFTGGTTDWIPLTVSALAPENAMLLRMDLRLRGTGKVWFDEVTLEAR